MLSLTSSEMEISATFSALPFSLVTKRSVLITRSTEMVLEMLLSLATTLLVFSRRLSSVELLLFRSLLPQKTKMEKLLSPLLRLTEILSILSYSVQTTPDLSSLVTRRLLLVNALTKCSPSPISRPSTIASETSLMVKWNPLLNGTKRCSTSTDSGLQMISKLTPNTLPSDPSSWLILMKKLRCLSTSLLMASESLRLLSSVSSTVVPVSSTSP